MFDKVLLKPLMPIIKKVLASNQIDISLQDFKAAYSEHIQNEGESIVLVNSTEYPKDGAKEYINICVADKDMNLRLLEQYPLNEAISKLIEENI